MGGQGSGRPGGNPELSQHKFETDRLEPLTEQLQLRVTKSMRGKLQQLEDWKEFVREAIAEKLEREAPATGQLEQGQLSRDTSGTEDNGATEPTGTAGNSRQAPTGGDTAGGEDEAGDTCAESESERSPSARTTAGKTAGTGGRGKKTRGTRRRGEGNPQALS